MYCVRRGESRGTISVRGINVAWWRGLVEGGCVGDVGDGTAADGALVGAGAVSWAMAAMVTA